MLKKALIAIHSVEIFSQRLMIMISLVEGLLASYSATRCYTRRNSSEAIRCGDSLRLIVNCCYEAQRFRFSIKSRRVEYFSVISRLIQLLESMGEKERLKPIEQITSRERLSEVAIIFVENASFLIS